MKVAVSTDQGQVSAHFGRCPIFTIAEVEDGEVKNTTELPNPGHAPGAIPEFLNQQGIKAIIAGGMGQRALMFFDQFGITPVVGVTGTVDDVLASLANGTLKGGESLCSPGGGKGYGLDKQACDHPNDKDCD